MDKQYRKLFDKSEIEYITPFLKLWMSFNNWFKNYLNKNKKNNNEDKNKNITDRKAINKLKEGGEVKDEFKKLWDGSYGGERIDFENSLWELVVSNEKVVLKSEDREPKIFFIEDENYGPDKLIYKGKQTKEGKPKKGYIFISQQKRELCIKSDDKDKFFEETLEFIYQARCKLVHGDYDIENKSFYNLVEHSYKVLYLIMKKVLENERFTPVNDKN